MTDNSISGNFQKYVDQNRRGENCAWGQKEHTKKKQKKRVKDKTKPVNSQNIHKHVKNGVYE